MRRGARGARISTALRLVALAALLSLLSPHAADSQERFPEGNRVTISGTVLDAISRRPIEGVMVQINYMGYVVETNIAGRFTLLNIPVGNYQLSLSHPGYHPAVGDFAIMRSGEFETAMDPVVAGEDELMTGIVGVVSDDRTGGPVDGASVRLRTGDQGTRTDARGRFALDELTPGLNIVGFTQLGYATRTETIEVLPGRVTNVRLSLSADPVQLDPIVVTVERREIALQDAGYYNRLEEGFGDFIDRAEIESRGPVEMSDIFSRIPGVELFADPDNPIEKYVVLRGGRQASFSSGPYGRCFPRVVLDGLVINRGGDDPAGLDRMLDPVAIAGVEVFPTSSGVPAQYGGVGSSCGVILIWTRR
ncbi:MAG: TonB-dependent receptor plug domain-containing protein [Gemmatimonadetes bacterium]|nr:TonB-dependent receptor plug domain-containing protein [Gemmatimonadota bacterium]MYG21463.1 TonB-dependent receptor plug domain-containing protein [Gemmatimonadota bacterium]MYJ38071.1 TonB-dependent receptor plug domain-containing protein [Gemmatimonadota bacterium]